MLLDTPDYIYLFFLLSTAFFIAFGYYYHQDKQWSNCFNAGIEIYKKSGEYGEFHLQSGSKSPWKEPYNAATSLAYCMFGGVILLTGLHDYITLISFDDRANINILTKNGTLSMIYGISCICLGVSSFFFHASHDEVWRKRDAGLYT